MPLQPGDRVVCDDDFVYFGPHEPFTSAQVNLPVQEQTYTVRSVVQTPHGPGIRLKEVQNAEFYYADVKGRREPIFNPTRFHQL